MAHEHLRQAYLLLPIAPFLKVRKFFVYILKYADDTIAISGFFFFLLIVTPPYFLRMYILILKPAKVNRV